MKKLILFFILLTALRLSADAEIISFTCPTANSINFIPLAPNLNLASAEVNTYPSFLISGETIADKADNMYAAYYEPEKLICRYHGFDQYNQQVEINLTNSEYTPLLDRCYFKKLKWGDHDCQGNNEACRLICEVL